MLCSQVVEPDKKIFSRIDVGFKIFKYSQLLFNMVKFTIVNSDNLPRWRSGYAVDCRSTTTRFDSGPWLGGIMSIRIQKTFEALFALEEVRGLFRESLPTGFDAEEEAAFHKADCRSQGNHC